MVHSSGKEAMKREYPDRPWVGVGVLVFKSGKVLLGRRAREPRMGQWSVPGGTIELGETVREAATREIREEFNIQIEIQQVFDVFDRIFRDPEGRVQFHYVLIECVARYQSGELRPADDVEEAEWVDPQELLPYELPADQIEVIKRVAQKIAR
jgi:mutator protein MutT